MLVPTVDGRVIGALVALGMATTAQAQSRGVPVTAFTHVAVIPMEDTNRVLPDQTVLVRGDRIVALGPAAKVPVPAGARRIDGRGKYLIPGLGDMHAHVGGGGGNTPASVERDLFLYAANGVTTVRSVNYIHSDSLVLRARARAAAGTLWSPRVYASGVWRPNPKESVVQSLVAYQAAGYDFIKLGETGALLDSIAAAARLLGIPFMGHVGDGDSVAHALAVHYASIEHLTGYPGAGIAPGPVPADTARLSEMIAATKRSGVWNCPTQAIYEVWWDSDPLAWPENQYAWPHHPPAPDSLTVIWGHLRHRIIKGLQEAGAGLLLGTDAPFLVPGFGVHRELQALVRSGLTPYQALATGTRNIAAYFGTLREVGTVTVGKRADLVLLTGNPLEDIRHTMNPAGVMLAGRWLDRATIDRRLQQAATTFAAQKAGQP